MIKKGFVDLYIQRESKLAKEAATSLYLSAKSWKKERRRESCEVLMEEGRGEGRGKAYKGVVRLLSLKLLGKKRWDVGRRSLLVR